MGKENRQTNTTLTENQTTQSENKKNDSKSTLIIWISVIGIAAVLGCIVAKFVFLGSSGSKYKVVDLYRITEAQKNEARQLVLKDGVTEDQMGAILEDVQKKMNKIERLVQEEASTCNCTIFVKSAIVADTYQPEDITDRILEKLRDK